jgi:uncharacterized protein (DUF952 family)
MHCSTKEQLPGTAERHFKGRHGLVLLHIDPGLLTSELRWEAGYPHVYGPLNLDAVISLQTFRA